MEPVHKRNMCLNAYGEGLWGFGGNLAAPLTVLTLILLRLGGSTFEVGLLSAIGAAGILFPQVFGALILQRGVGRKSYLIWFHYICIIPPWALMGVVLWWSGSSSPLTARILLPLLFALYISMIGFIIPVWLDWVAALFPQQMRGRAFGWSAAASAGGGALAAIVAGWITGLTAYPLNYSLLFFIGSFSCVLSMLIYMRIQEPEDVVLAPEMSRAEIFSRFRQSLTYPDFRTYLVARLLLTAGVGSIAFYAVHYHSPAGGKVSEGTLISLGAAIYVSQSVTSYLLGRLGDRFGHRLGAIIGALAQVGGLVAAIAIPGTMGAALTYAMVGTGVATAWVSHTNLLLETCPHDCRSAHITIANLVLAPLTTLVPIVTGKAVEIWGTTTVFGWCLVPTLLGLAWFQLFVKEPRSVEYGTSWRSGQELESRE